MALPIEAVLGDVISALRDHNMCVLQAPPGAGKTTRVPLALLDANLFEGKIVMLEPRRLATRAAADRLAKTLGEAVGTTVGYAMRGANTTHKNSRIDVVTEGVLTRMIQKDPALTGISAILFDEFHERSLQADLGLALALEVRSVLRPDLCLMAMSATLDAGPVAELMGNAPVITSEGRGFPVTIHHLDKPWRQSNTSGKKFEDAMANLIEKAVDENKGNILVFLPGVGEIKRLENKLKHKLPSMINIMPLFGAMPFADQQRAIAPSPHRKLVLATSVAETSLTIEGITVVVDSGLARRGRFHPASGMGALVTDRVSKAEATQRTGRAGRLAPGHCYRLWTKGEEGGLAPFAPPEILTSDLTALVLELALWGDVNAESLSFLQHPKEADLNTAIQLLQDLGALDKDQKLTQIGREMAVIPLHPRLARLLIGGGSTQLAALIEGRDVLGRSPNHIPVDMALRVEALRDPVKFGKERPYRVNRHALERINANAKRLRGRPEQNLTIGQVAALAYPDRIALRRNGTEPRFLLANGTGAILDATDPMANDRMLVAVDLDGKKTDARIRLAASITESELRALYAERIVEKRVCSWNRREKRVQAVQQSSFGALVLSQSRWADCPDDLRAKALCIGIKELGMGALPWSKAANLLRARIEWARASGLDLPNSSDEALLDTLNDWLLPHIKGRSTIEALGNLDLSTLIFNRLDWNTVQELNKMAPSSLTAPTGTKMAVDYSAEQPKISVRLQELFGLDSHPTLGKNRVPLVIELLSPAGRPVQKTSDLPAFWQSSYADVRKDMRGRYPKHPWPEDPLAAPATRRVKSKGT